jgi:GntR family transcriptional regulator, vanillate catabolism transcriptional regulator
MHQRSRSSSLRLVMARLTEVQGVSLADQAREAIRTAILDGSFAPEERLTIEQLAAELGVSRTPVREALKALEGDGLVELQPHRGVIVAPLAREELQHRYSIRAMLEGFGAELACQRDAPGVARALGANCEQLAALVPVVATDDLEGIKRMSELNQEFHRLIRDGSHSATLERILIGLRNPLAFTINHWREPDLRRASLDLHLEITEAFRRRAPKQARRLVERHLLESRDHLMARGVSHRQNSEDRATASARVVA